MPRRKMMRPRRARRALRRAIRRPRTTGARLIDKVYTFKHTLIDQYLKGSNSAAGAVDVVSANPGSTSKPLTTGTLSSITASGIGFNNFYDFGGAVHFSLVDMSNHAAYTGLFDNYRINSVTCHVEFLANTANVTGVGLMPTMYWFADQDDSSIPTIISAVTGRMGHKKFTFTANRTRLSITVKPKVAVNVFNTTAPATIGFQQGGKGWQDCVYPENEYYGLKFWATNVYLNGSENTNTAFRFSWTYNVSYKGALNSF